MFITKRVRTEQEISIKTEMMNKENVKLSGQKCEPCSGDIPPLEGEELQNYYNRLDDGWELVDNHHLKKSYDFKNFKEALDFTVKVGEMSEEEGHHPEIVLTWGKVAITVYTHAIDGLSDNDFIWAAKADELYE